ncbi:MAG TPA: hypothetical protein VFQ75_00160 [Candidatus Limnocylindrales bacterium]|nr:hypothetical protein [Candidatus Limnocylindrales bacterium]
MSQDVFYGAVSTASFTLLGLWLVVVQAREEWRFQRARRQMAYIVSLHFLLPGAMSVLALAAPDQAIVWRVSFAVAGAIGIAGVALIARTLREDADCPRIVRWLQWVVLPVYVLITTLAVAPGIVQATGLGLTPLQTEAIVLALLFFGTQSAWFLLLEPTREERRARAERDRERDAANPPPSAV